MRTWVGHHQTSQIVFVLQSLRADILHIDVSVFITLRYHYLHTRHYRRSWVSSVCTRWNQCDVSVRFAAILEIFTNHHQTSILSLSSRIWLHAHGIETSDLTQIFVQLLNDLHVTLRLIHWNEWVQTVELGPGYRNHFSGCIQLHGTATQRNHRMT